MISKLLLFFIFTIPFFGKNIDYSESIIFYIIPSVVFLYLLIKKQKLFLPKKVVFFQNILLLLSLISTIFSKNIGSSYYQFFIFLNSIFVFSVAINLIEPKSFSLGLIISSLIYSIVFLLNKFGILFISQDILNDNFILQNWGHSYVAEILVLAIPFLLQKIFTSKKPFYLIISIIIFTATFLTNSRSAIFVTIISVILFKIKEKTNNRVKISLIFLCILALIFNFYKVNDSSQLKSYDGERTKYWKQSIQGFLESPIFGNGPNTFQYTNKKFQNNNSDNTLYSHSSLFGFLSENGLVFTIFFFFLIVKSLIKTSKENSLFFISGLISLIYSLIDFSWNTPGIFIISLYLIFYYPIYESKKIKTKIYLSIIFLIILFFSITKTSSDFFFLKNDYKKSISLDYFNLNPRLETIKNNNFQNDYQQKNLKTVLKLYKNETGVYETLINTVPFPQNEEYYFKLIKLQPSIKLDLYIKLIDLYKNSDELKFEKILTELDNFSIESMSHFQKVNLSKFYYNYAINIFETNSQKSLKYFEKTVKLIPTLGHFHVDLANAYWHNNQKNKAINQLKNICEQYSDPKKQCEEYLKAHQNSDFNQPGQEDLVQYINNFN